MPKKKTTKKMGPSYFEACLRDHCARESNGTLSLNALAAACDEVFADLYNLVLPSTVGATKDPQR